MTVRCRLLAIDVDGTLVRDDGSIDASDRAAIDRAQASGILVTLATGRMPAQTLPVARSLGLQGPLVCADGAMTVMPDGSVRSLITLCPAARERLLELSARTAMPSLFLAPDRVLGLDSHRGDANQLAAWSDAFEALLEEREILAPGREVVAGFLLGTAANVAHASELHALGVPRGEEQVETFWLGLPGRHTLRMRPAGVDKGSALAQLAQSFGILSSETAAIGNWFNDVGMLTWASSSFAMGHAPEEVARSARRKLRATAALGGGIAEVVAELLDSTVQAR
jgi:Cof subfamily protein (haloacid dehalogenase superfamily)